VILFVWFDVYVWELPKNVEIRKSIYTRITNTRFMDPLFENFAYIKKNHIFSLLLPFQFPYPLIFATCYPFPEIFTSFPFPPNCANSPFYPSVHSSSVQNLKSVLKLYLETIGGGERDGRTHTHQTKRRVSHNTSPLRVEGYTKPSAELEINVDVYLKIDNSTKTDNTMLNLANFPFCLFNSLILQYLPHVTHFPK
jgi:hypothetical protein